MNDQMQMASAQGEGRTDEAQEQAVLSAAILALTAWISQLPHGSEWRLAFAAIRCELASCVELPA